MIMLLCRKIVLRHLKNIYNVRSARAVLTGLAEGYMFAKNRTSEITATQLLEQWRVVYDSIDPTKGYITAQIKSLGLPYNHKGEMKDNDFILSVLLVDSKTIIDIPFQVGDKIQRIYDKDGTPTLELNLELWSDTPLPDVQPYEYGDGGFNASVDDWGEEQFVEMDM